MNTKKMPAEAGENMVNQVYHETFKDVAEGYRQRGYAPIPIQPGTKRPAVAWKDAGAWDDAAYTGLEADPRATSWGVGILTDGLAVLDVDAADEHAKDADGVAAFTRLETELGKLPPTYTNTARGGDSRSRHYLYRLPEAYTGRKLHSPAPGIDLRTDGGQILVWPSVHPDTHTEYTWYAPDGGVCGVPRRDELPLLPEPWCERLTIGTVPSKPTARTAPTNTGTVPSQSDTGPCKGVMTAYTKWVNDPAAKGSRHDTTRDAIHKLALMHAEGHRGADVMIQTIAAEYAPMVADARTGGIDEAAKEVARMIDGEAGPLGSIPASEDPCVIYRRQARQDTTPEERPTRPTRGFDMTELMTAQFKPLDYIVPGVMSVGLSLLVAPPKIGKSWMALDMAYRIATGGKVFDAIPVRCRPVLYLALEDGPRRLQSRLRALGATQATDRLRFIIDTDDILGEIRGFYEEHAEEHPLVIVDTLAKYLQACPSDAGRNAYVADYEHVGALQRLAIDAEGGLLLVHHTNKGRGDMVDTVSGTHGIAGSADTIISLDRPRFGEDAVMRVTSRDAEEGEYGMTFAANRWRLQGGTLDAARNTVAETRTRSRAGDNTAAVLDLLHAHPEGVTPAMVAEETTLDAKHAANRLQQLAAKGIAAKVGRGKYRLL